MLRLKYLIPLLIFLFVCVFLFVGLYLSLIHISEPTRPY